jgi:caa(3)-type oxidase subunit IV
MASSATHPGHASDHTKEYLRIFYILIVITVVEVAVVYLPLPTIVIQLLVVSLSVLKAVMVGWHYMHLKHESKGLIAVVLLPLIMFVYAFFLGIDAGRRAPSPYVGAPERVVLKKGEKAETSAPATPSAEAEKK